MLKQFRERLNEAIQVQGLQHHKDIRAFGNAVETVCASSDWKNLNSLMQKEPDFFIELVLIINSICDVEEHLMAIDYIYKFLPLNSTTFDHAKHAIMQYWKYKNDDMVHHDCLRTIRVVMNVYKSVDSTFLRDWHLYATLWYAAMCINKGV